MLRSLKNNKHLSPENIPEVPTKLVISSYLLFGAYGGMLGYILPVDILLTLSAIGLAYYGTGKYVKMLSDYDRKCVINNNKAIIIHELIDIYIRHQ